jgi:hypothetical protein
MANPIYDTTTDGKFITGGPAYTSYTYSHTVAAQNNRLLVVFADGFTVSGITYNGVSLTNLGISPTANTNSGLIKLQSFYLLNPSTGTNDVEITWNASRTSHLAGSISFYGVSQANQPVDAKDDAIDYDEGGNATATLTIDEDDCVFIGAILGNASTSFADGETETLSTDIGSRYFRIGYGFDDTGSQVVSSSGGNTKVLCAVAFRPGFNTFDPLLLLDYA